MNGKSLFYDPTVNRFEDENGKVIHDLHEFFGTWQLDKWKKTKDYALIVDKTGKVWELFYNYYGTYDRCRHECLLCGHRCEIFNFIDWRGEFDGNENYY